ncbi:hypothetical protein [Streptomyces violaceusniger]|uniref:hypothetical protein n=1 Tax=Streptomyces violaceusniger TaxID=68280 RepID=UPI00382743C3
MTVINAAQRDRPNSPKPLLRHQRHVTRRQTGWLPISLPKQWLSSLLPHWLYFTLSETARSSYQGSLEAVRRTPQREAYAGLVTSTHLYLAKTRNVLKAAEELDQNAEPSGWLVQDDTSGLLFEERKSLLIDELTDKLTKFISHANDHAPVMTAAAVVCLEGPAGRVTDAAEEVEKKAELLHKRLSDAGYWPDTEQQEPDPYRAEEAHSELEAAIDAFTETARAHLNGHQSAPRA